MSRKLFSLCIYFLLMSFTLRAQESEIYYPDENWRSANPVDAGFPENFAENLNDAISDDTFSGLRSLLVVQDGSLIYEYYHSATGDSLHGIRSVTKSITATVIGVALQQGDLDNIDISLGDIIPDYFEAETANSDLTDITMRDLLMMRSGIEWDDTSNNVLRLRNNDLDHTPWILSRPLAESPGTVWNYSTADTQLVSVMFQHIVGQSLEDYAASYLFEPLGITEWEWRENGGNYSSGGAELSLTARDMARIGYLYVQDGQWDGEQLLSEEWINLTTSPQIDPAYYGYCWWILSADDADHRVYAASGFGGQFIYILPDDGLIVVATNEWLVSDARDEIQYGATRNLIREEILALVIELE